MERFQYFLPAWLSSHYIAVGPNRTVSEDAELLERIRNGSSDDFTEIVRRYQAQVFAILYKYERDHQKLEDLAQETFVKAWRFLDKFDERAPFHHWLSRIAVHVALDHLRRQKRFRAELAMEDLGEEVFEWLHDPNAEARLEAGRAGELLNLAMSELSPEDRQVITLLELEGCSVKEICALTGWTSPTVRVRAFRARARLKKILTRMQERTNE
ncbi:RNA polymerase sigma factor [Pedosphaera parvula]|nr:sigma-70 family RNA polymerase sigma factor [Pedosphaera parvula]